MYVHVICEGCGAVYEDNKYLSAHVATFEECPECGEEYCKSCTEKHDYCYEIMYQRNEEYDTRNT